MSSMKILCQVVETSWISFEIVSMKTSGSAEKSSLCQRCSEPPPHPVLVTWLSTWNRTPNRTDKFLRLEPPPPPPPPPSHPCSLTSPFFPFFFCHNNCSPSTTSSHPSLPGHTFSQLLSLPAFDVWRGSRFQMPSRAERKRAWMSVFFSLALAPSLPPSS